MGYGINAFTATHCLNFNTKKESIAVSMQFFPIGAADKMEKSKYQNSMFNFFFFFECNVVH